MPDLSWNKACWHGGYDWSTGGEEWSEVWGGSEPQWFGSLYPRLHRFLPAGAILEIAPGFGRWTRFLIPACRDYVGIDLSGECISACRSTFAQVAHARFTENDGLSLDSAPEGHFDFVFSFDSLVHAESDVMQSYLPQILRKLTPHGVAFIHHSNVAALDQGTPNKHARGASVSADTVSGMISEASGKVLLQECMNWGGPHLTDCLTLFSREDHPTASAPRVENFRFMEEARIIRETQAPWSR